MTVTSVMLVGARPADPVAAIASVQGLADVVKVIDTGMPAETRMAVEATGATVINDSWDGSGPTFTRALQRVQGDWILHLHADETAEWHPDLPTWLQADESPETDAFMVEIRNPNLTHRLPRLLRGNQPWEYVGAAHEYLALKGKRTRPLTGLTLHHHGSSDPAKFEQTLEELRPAFENGDPRAVFYTAETLRDLGRTDEAIAAYRQRMTMGGWDEELWYAHYQAAKLTGDVEELLFVHRQRPHRHEPLSAAAKIVAERSTGDVLFLETL